MRQTDFLPIKKVWESKIVGLSTLTITLSQIPQAKELLDNATHGYFTTITLAIIALMRIFRTNTIIKLKG